MLHILPNSDFLLLFLAYQLIELNLRIHSASLDVPLLRCLPDYVQRLNQLLSIPYAVLLDSTRRHYDFQYTCPIQIRKMKRPKSICQRFQLDIYTTESEYRY